MRPGYSVGSTAGASEVGCAGGTTEKADGPVVSLVDLQLRLCAFTEYSQLGDSRVLILTEDYLCILERDY